MSDVNFADRLAQLRAENCEQLPTPELAVMARAIARLRREGLAKRCLQVGETAPDFSYSDADGGRHRCYEALQRGPVVLNFFRGFWCPYCQTELEAYTQIQGVLDELGATYFAISPQPPESAGALPPNYTVVHDHDNQIARDFGVAYRLHQDEIDLFRSWGLNLDEVHGTSGWELPVPATFVVCQDHTIGYEFVDVDFRARCCPDQLIEELRGFCNC